MKTTRFFATVWLVAAGLGSGCSGEAEDAGPRFSVEPFETASARQELVRVASVPLPGPPEDIMFLGDTAVVLVGGGRAAVVRVPLEAPYRATEAFRMPPDLADPVAVDHAPGAFFFLTGDGTVLVTDREGVELRRTYIREDRPYFAVGSDSSIYAETSEYPGFFLYRDDTALQRDRPFARRPVPAFETVSRARSGTGLLSMLAAGVGDTIHVFSNRAGVLLKYGPDGELVSHRRLPGRILNPLVARTEIRVGRPTRPLIHALEVGCGGELVLSLPSGDVAALVVDPLSYAAVEVRRGAVEASERSVISQCGAAVLVLRPEAERMDVWLRTTEQVAHAAYRGD